MASYDFKCRACGDRFGVVRPMTDNGPVRCPGCFGLDTVQVYSATPAVFKAGGFYSTDNRK